MHFLNPATLIMLGFMIFITFLASTAKSTQQQMQQIDFRDGGFWLLQVVTGCEVSNPAAQSYAK